MLGAPFARRTARTPHRIAALTAVAALAALAAACGSSDGDHPGGPPFQVGGTVQAATGSAVDSDVNDFHSPFAPNDSAAQAQAIGNPVSLGGHVNQPGKGAVGSESGRTFARGDLQDWFRVSIAAGQTIRLRIAEEDPLDEQDPRNDLDLELRRLDETLVASSATQSRIEEISVPVTGDYYVVVRVVADFSNYTLTIGDPPASAALAREPEFVPGQVVVRYRDVRGRPAASGVSRARSIGMRHLSGESDGPMLFAAETLAERRQAFARLGIAPTAEMQGGKSRGERGLRDDTRKIAAALRRRAEVRSADLNYVRRATAIPADEFYPRQWHYEQIRLPEAWDATAPNSGVVVAVLDTGVKLGHPDFTGQLVPGFDFISDTAISNDGDGCDANPDDPGDGAPPRPSSYHGTHVAGTVAARTSFSSGDATGVAGVAWNARILPLRVLGVGGGTDADVMSALRYAAGRAGTCAGLGSSTPARIANMSLGGPGYSQTFQDLITDLRNNEGMIFVAAAGNEATLQPQYPASYAGVISVSAVGPTKTRAPYSNFGFTIDVAAPGGDLERDVNLDGFPDGVFSTIFRDGVGFDYGFFEGTSMATPHVAGVFALMLGINPALTTFDIDNALNSRQITEDIGSSQFYGNGLIDAARAVNYASTNPGGAPLDPVLRVDPDTVNFGYFANDVHLVASNGGNAAEPLTVTGVSFTSDDGAAWLTVTPQSVVASGLGTYRATVDRSGLADGIYTGTIHFTSSENDVEVDVIVLVGAPISAQANAGHHYILLVDVGPHPREPQAEVDAHAVNGGYGFGFPTTAPGEYLLIAGTDNDGDFVTCDSGEACGAYPTVETAVPIAVDRDQIGLRFLTGFTAPFGAAAAGVAGEQRGYSIDP